MSNEKAVGAEVRDPEYKGVAITHPSIVNGIRNLAKQGKTKEQIMKTIGMPGEVVDKHMRAVKEGR